MTRRALIFPLAATLLLAAPPRVPRLTMANLERQFDRRLQEFDVNDPLFLIGGTRGVYLEGFGAVFTTELGLVTAPALTPFRQSISEEDKTKLRKRKLERVPQVRRLMRNMLVQSGNVLTAVPQQEQIAIGMVLFYAPWENKTGLPQQMLMQAQRKVLVDFEAGRANETQLEAAIRVEEY